MCMNFDCTRRACTLATAAAGLAGLTRAEVYPEQPCQDSLAHVTGLR
jgi:hypothetical protein